MLFIHQNMILICSYGNRLRCCILLVFSALLPCSSSLSPPLLVHAPSFLPPISVPFFLIPVRVVLSGWLLELDVGQHVSHGHHQTVYFLVKLPPCASHFQVVLRSLAALWKQRAACHLHDNTKLKGWSVW